MLAKIDIEIDGAEALQKAWAQAPQITAEELLAAMTEADLLVQRSVMEETPVKTGLLRGSIIGREEVMGEGVLGLVGTSIDYALPVELGTRPHKIEAKDGGVLTFMLNGRRVFVRSVNHPGTRGAHMFGKGFTFVQGDVEALFERARNRIAERLAPDDGATS